MSQYRDHSCVRFSNNGAKISFDVNYTDLLYNQYNRFDDTFHNFTNVLWI